MNDDQQQEQPDTRVPTVKRQRKLEAIYRQQKGTKSPYRDVKIRTLGELQWIMQERRWSGEYALGRPDRVPTGIQRANFSGADFNATNLSGVILNGANLCGAALDSANLSKAQLNGANLNGADLARANLSGSQLRDANLSEAQLYGANLNKANLNGANLSRSTLLGAADLSEATLQDANLSEANFSDAYLYKTDLTRADLHEAEFLEAYLGGAILDSANVRGAGFNQASLCDASCSGADFSGAYLGSADVTNTHFTESILTDADFNHYKGEPHWPTLSEADWQSLVQEVTMLTTPSERLRALTWRWPGVLVHEYIAANPNTPSSTLRSLAQSLPLIVLRNPVLPLLFLSNPLLLHRHEAQCLLDVLDNHSSELIPADEDMMRLIAYCAQVES